MIYRAGTKGHDPGYSSVEVMSNGEIARAEVLRHRDGSITVSVDPRDVDDIPRAKADILANVLHAAATLAWTWEVNPNWSAEDLVAEFSPAK